MSRDAFSQSRFLVLVMTSAALFCGLAAFQTASEAESGRTANPRATVDARHLLEYLHSLPQRKDGRLLSGQNIGSANVDALTGYTRFYEGLKIKTGRRPALLGACYGYEEMIPSKIAEVNKLLIRHWTAGGLVTVSMAPRNPWTGGELRDRSLGEFNFMALVTSGTAPNRRWLALLDTVADGLAELQEAGVVVLWRPLHEMNGAFFWWSAGSTDGWATPREFQALWRYTFRYLTETRKLDNLIWVYSANVQTNRWVKPTTHYYPGAKFVDVVGLDSYANNLANLNAGRGYDALAALGKPIGLTEVGPHFQPDLHPNGRFDGAALIDQIRADYAQACFFLYWHGWSSSEHNVRMAIVQNQGADQLLDDPWVVSLETIDRRSVNAK